MYPPLKQHGKGRGRILRTSSIKQPRPQCHYGGHGGPSRSWEEPMSLRRIKPRPGAGRARPSPSHPAPKGITSLMTDNVLLFLVGLPETVASFGA